MSRQELVKWYDRAFEMFLACMAVLPYSRYRKEVETLTNKKKTSSVSKQLEHSVFLNVIQYLVSCYWLCRLKHMVLS